MKTPAEEILEGLRAHLDQTVFVLTKRIRQLEFDLRMAGALIAEHVMAEDHIAGTSQRRAAWTKQMAERLQDVAVEVQGERSAFLDQLAKGFEEGLTTPEAPHRTH